MGGVERGAAVVEFALILPVFVALALGLFTGGLAYNRKITLTNAAREASRYGATLPVTTTLDTWLTTVASIAQQNASGELDTGKPGREICVAYVYPAGVAGSEDVNRRLIRTDAGGDVLSSGTCFSDGRPDTERRVQVEVEGSSQLQAMVYSSNLSLRASSVTTFEAWWS